MPTVTGFMIFSSVFGESPASSCIGHVASRSAALFNDKKDKLGVTFQGFKVYSLSCRTEHCTLVRNSSSIHPLSWSNT